MKTTPHMNSPYRDFTRTVPSRNMCFYQMNQVVMMVNALPHDEFNESPTVHKEQSGSRMKDLSAAEKAKPNKYAKALIMSDNRKAAAIGDYVKTILKKGYCASS